MSIFILTLSLFLSSGCLRRAGTPDTSSDESFSDSNTKSSKNSKSNLERNQSADFRVLPITGRFIDDKIDSIWTIPTQKTYEFRACFIGRSTNAQLPEGQEFMVIMPDKTAIKTRTDDLGCANWQEKIDFNYTSDSVYIKKPRRLKSIGAFKGEVFVDIGVNPWISYHSDMGTEEVLDLNRTSIATRNVIDESDEDLLRQGLFKNDDSSSKLHLEPNLNINISPVKDTPEGKKLRLFLPLNPFLNTKNLRGQPERFDLRTGNFRVFATLISRNVGLQANQHTILTPKILPRNVKINDAGQLEINFDFDLKYRVDMGQVQLALRIEPLNTPYPIRPYEALHVIGSYDSILGANSAIRDLSYLSDQSTNLADYIESATNIEELKKHGIAQNLPPVYFDYLDPRFIRIKSGETSTQRTLMYRVTTLVRDSISGQPVRFQPFRIKKILNNTEDTVQTDENGRLIWNDELSHLYYKPEQYYFPEFHIIQVVSGDAQKQGYTFKQTIAVNPWDFGWTFGVDTRGQEQYYYELSKRRVNPPQFMIDAFRYQTIRFRYVIDEFLTLNVKKAVVMALDPLVERNTINEGRKFEPLRNGIYLVKIALVKYYLDPFQNNTRLVNVEAEANGDGGFRPVQCDGFDDEDSDNEDVIKPAIANASDYPSSNVTNEAEGSENKTEEPKSKFRLEAVACNGEAKKGQYTTVIKKLLRVQAGRITTPLEFSMRDLRMMSIRSNIMVQLETIDENKLLRDNLANQKLDQLVEEYYAFNTEGMGPEEKAAFLKEKMQLHLEESEKLKTAMKSGLEQIQAEREALSTDFEARDAILQKLTEDLGKSAESSAIYQQNINLPEEEFLKRINQARTELNQLHTRIEDYWSDYEKNWVESQLTQQSEKGLLAIPKEQLSKKPTYYDYLASMNTFLKDFGLGSSVNADDLESLEINNYSDNPLTPLVDLNLYRENSGLASRTFIGPCTLVENDNMSEMRPTDKIDEAATSRIDNSQEVFTESRLNPPADNREFEQSAYHDSLIEFRNKSVDDIILDHIQNEKNYEREMTVLSQMGRYVRGFNLQYVSLTDQKLKEFKVGCSFAPNEDCFEETTKDMTFKEDFIKTLNAKPSEELLARYFYVRPLSLTQQLNEEIAESDLEPLLSRSLRSAESWWNWLVVPEEEQWLRGFDFNAIGTRNGGLFSSEPDYEKTAKEYLKSNHSNRTTEISSNDLKNWLKKGVNQITLLEALKICDLLTSEMYKNLVEQGFVAEKSGFFESGKPPQDYLLEYCFSKIHYIDDESIEKGDLKLHKSTQAFNKPKNRVLLNGITFDRRFKIHKTGPYEHIAGKNTNLNVGVDFSVTGYTDSQTVGSLGVNGGALLGVSAAGVGALIGGSVTGPLAPVGAAVGGAIGAGLGAVANLLVAQEASNFAYGVNMTRNTSVSMATYLVIQKAEMDIVLEQYENCLSLQFSPEMINDLHFDKLKLNKGISPKNLKLRQVLSRGYFICEGKITDTPIRVRENYYYVTQHFTAGDMLDNVNLLNHVWLLSLRGERDFNAFINTMVGKEIGQDGENIDTDRLYDYSLYRLSTVYGKVLPTFPGMYSIQDPIPIHIRSDDFPRGF